MNSFLPWKRRKDEENVFYPMTKFQQKMNSLFEDFFKEFEDTSLIPWGSGSEKAEFAPRLDVLETDKEIKVNVELPGMSDKDVDVSLDRNILTIKGQKEQTQEDKQQHYHCVERRFGSFYRSIPVPAEVDQNKIEATFKNGILSISLPKKETIESKGKKIEVKNA